MLEPSSKKQVQHMCVCACAGKRPMRFSQSHLLNYPIMVDLVWHTEKRQHTILLAFVVSLHSFLQLDTVIYTKTNGEPKTAAAKISSQFRENIWPTSTLFNAQNCATIEVHCWSEEWQQQQWNKQTQENKCLNWSWTIQTFALNKFFNYYSGGKLKSGCGGNAALLSFIIFQLDILSKNWHEII